MNQPDFFTVTAGDCNTFYVRAIGDQQVGFVLEFAGSLEIERLKNALDLLYTTLPILATKIEVKPHHLRRVREPNQLPSLKILEKPVDRLAELTTFISTPCDPEKELPLKVLLIRSEGEDTLCVKIDHTVTDAAGLKFLLGLLAEAYTHGQIVQKINFKRGFGQIFRKVSLPSLIKASTKSDIAIPGPAIIQKFLSERTFIEQATLAPDQFKQVSASSNQLNATVNDILLAGLFRTIFTHIPTEYGEPFPVMLPVDMRRYLDADERGTIANLSSAAYPKLTRIPGEIPADTLRRVKAYMDVYKQNQPGLEALLLMTLGALNGGKILHARYQFAASRGSNFIILSNFGIIDAQRLAFAELMPKQVYGIGPLQNPPGILIAISTYQENLHLVVQSRGDDTFQLFIHHFLEDIFRQLA
jgi:NRPS condensation-like uncharacterized protein